MKKTTILILILFFAMIITAFATSFSLFNSFLFDEGTITFNFAVIDYVCMSSIFLSIVLGVWLFVRFLKSLKLSNMLFFAILPLSLVFFGLMYFLLEIQTLNDNASLVIKEFLNITPQNNNVYYALLITIVLYFVFLFFVFKLVARPLKKIENAASKLTMGEVPNSFCIGGNKQFSKIEESLNKINNNYKMKNNFIEHSAKKNSCDVPKDFLRLFGKKVCSELEIGSAFTCNVTLFHIKIKSIKKIAEQNSMKDNFDFYHSYINVVLPILEKNNAFIQNFDESGITAAFLQAEKGYLCAKSIFRAVEKINKNNDDAVKIDVSFCFSTTKTKIEVVSCENNITLNCLHGDELVLMQQVNTKFSSYCVCDSNTLNSFDKNLALKYRYIGNIILYEENILQVYEILDMYKKKHKDALQKTKKDFETAVKLFNNAKFEKASEIFKKLLKSAENDFVCYNYYNKCIENMEN